MSLSLRHRIVLTVVPLLSLGAVLGVAGLVLLYRLGGRIDVILRENYDSVVAMVGLNEALERIDSSFQFAMTGQVDPEAYARYWRDYDRYLEIERQNITLPGEKERVERLDELTRLYREEGRAFFAGTPRREDYYGTEQKPGLFRRFNEIKTEAEAIRQMNQDAMTAASADAMRTARTSCIWFGVGWLLAGGLAGFFAWQTSRTVMRPIRELTESAHKVAAGNLNQVVPVLAHDELGQLADSFNDMTEQLRAYRHSAAARLLRAQRTSQATIDAFPDPVVVVDTLGHVEMVNPMAHRVLGAAVGEAPAMPWQPPESLRQPLADALTGQRAFLPESFEQAIAFQLAGVERVYLPRILPIRDPHEGPLGAAVVLNDVTRFRLMDRMKSDMIATVSHELKTPLTSVRLVIHLLIEETIGPLTAKQIELLMDARENAERLLKTIDQLLALARFEHGRADLKIRPESPAELLRAVAETVAPRAESKHINLTLELAPDLPAVAADAERLSGALNNLLDNALTYTAPGGRITLSAVVDGPDRVCLGVADTGVGIPPEHLPHVFERFFRIPEHSLESSTGLGLSIVREVVTAHGGEIACESTLGHGTTFHIRLPIWRASP
jgi:signal transduction histidine kinase